MEYLLDLADVSGAMSLEGFQGSASPFKEELHRIRPFKGNLKVAERMRMLLADSQNVENSFRLRTCSRPIFYALHASSSWSIKKYVLPFKRIGRN